MSTGAVQSPPGDDERGKRTKATKVELPASLLHHKHLLFNRELSWLEFNRRVLEEALDGTHPLLERLKFLAIFSSNLDEFFMIRVSGLMEQLDEEVAELSPDGLTPAEQLKEISARLKPMVAEQMRALREDVLPELDAEGIRITPYKDLTKDERRALDEYFTENVFPILTPQAVDSSHPFPYISNLSLNIGLMVEPAEEHGGKFPPAMIRNPRFVRVKVPPVVPRLVPVGDSGTRFTFLGELIAANISALFPGRRVGRACLFRVTRGADIEIREDEADDLLRAMQEQLRKRRFGDAVRLEVTKSMPAEMVRYLADELELGGDDVYVIDGPLNVPDLMSLYALDRPELKDAPLQTTTPAPLKESKSVFDSIKKQDILLHHPFTSYATVTDFIDAAASQAGVKIDLVVRGTCMLRPGVEGLSETITVRSVVGRFLEHSRVFYFANGGDEEVFIGSADWMRRNLDRRVEVVAPVDDPQLKRVLKEEILDSYTRDDVQARALLPDGSYARLRPREGEERFDSQTFFQQV